MVSLVECLNEALIWADSARFAMEILQSESCGNAHPAGLGSTVGVE